MKITTKLQLIWRTLTRRCHFCNRRIRKDEQPYPPFQNKRWCRDCRKLVLRASSYGCRKSIIETLSRGK